MNFTYEPSEQDILDSIGIKAVDRSGNAVELAQGLVLVEEAGEAVKELRTYLGHSRKLHLKRSPTQLLNVANEVADVVIAAQVLADLVGFDLEAAISAKLEGIKERGGI